MEEREEEEGCRGACAGCSSMKSAGWGRMCARTMTSNIKHVCELAGLGVSRLGMLHVCFPHGREAGGGYETPITWLLR